MWTVQQASLAPPRPLCGCLARIWVTIWQCCPFHTKILPRILISNKNTRLVVDHQFTVVTAERPLLAEDSCLGQLCINFFVPRQFWQNYQTNFANQTNHKILHEILCSLWDIRVTARIMGNARKVDQRTKHIYHDVWQKQKRKIYKEEKSKSSSCSCRFFGIPYWNSFDILGIEQQSKKYLIDCKKSFDLLNLPRIVSTRNQPATFHCNVVQSSKDSK